MLPQSVQQAFRSQRERHPLPRLWQQVETENLVTFFLSLYIKSPFQYLLNFGVITHKVMEQLGPKCNLCPLLIVSSDAACKH